MTQQERSAKYYALHPQRQVQRNQQTRARNRKFIRDYKQGKACGRCGFDNPLAFHFHHTGEKTVGIARTINLGWSLQRIQSEIDKCEIICANCHMIEHGTPS